MTPPQSDISMSDGEMERIDRALSDAFRSRMEAKSSKKGKIFYGQHKIFYGH